MLQCPRCGKTADLVNVDSGMIANLKAAGFAEPPSQVCGACMNEYKKSTAPAPAADTPPPMRSGGVLIVQERAKEQHRMTLWKSRVNLIRRARTMMQEKHYSEAAVAYEKYLKILEMVFGCKKGQRLTPEMFKDNARTSELTVVTSVYWDLLRIYDTGDSYGDRQEIAAKQLAAFVRYTPIFPDIIKKANLFMKQARKPNVIKMFLKAASEENARCFIATSAFGPAAPEVTALRAWRDQTLKRSARGRWFVKNYYRHSPKIARALDAAPILKPAVRMALRRWVSFLKNR